MTICVLSTLYIVCSLSRPMNLLERLLLDHLSRPQREALHNFFYVKKGVAPRGLAKYGPSSLKAASATFNSSVKSVAPRGLAKCSGVAPPHDASSEVCTVETNQSDSAESYLWFLALTSFAFGTPAVFLAVDLYHFILHMVSFIAFVGASSLTFDDAVAVRAVVTDRLASMDSLSVVVCSGGASGVDSIAVDTAKSLGFQTIVFMPKTNDWPGFKARNIQIAQKADSIIVIVLPLGRGTGKGECYHCIKVGKNNQHQVSGGCWTGMQHRDYEVVVLP